MRCARRGQEVQELREAGRAINALEPELELLERRGAARAARRLRERARTARRSTTCCPSASPRARGRPAHDRGCGHFDVQLIGGMVLHGGAIAEMRTGEGKTLTATLPVVAQRAGRQGRPRRHGQRLPGPPRRRVDGADLRLPRRDGRRSCRTCSRYEEKHDAYAADITYGTNSEFGFDYLRDNMAPTLEEKVQHGGRYRRGRRSRSAAHALRDRRRGRQHPDRRGAHAADHLRRARAGRRPLRASSPSWRRMLTPGKKPEGMDPRDEEGVRRRLRLRVRREAQDRRRSPSGASRRPSASSASTTSTAPRTATSSTT